VLTSRRPVSVQTILAEREDLVVAACVGEVVTDIDGDWVCHVLDWINAAWWDLDWARTGPGWSR
jgi:hypothetical protein